MGEIQIGANKVASVEDAAPKEVEATKQRATQDEPGEHSDSEFASSKMENGFYRCPTCGRTYRKLSNFKNHCNVSTALRNLLTDWNEWNEYPIPS